MWRRFESCSTLHDLINYVRSLPDVDPRAEVELTNVTTAPAVSLSRPHLAGPSGFAEWEKAWAVFAYACEALDICSPAVMEEYRIHILETNKKWSPDGRSW